MKIRKTHYNGRGDGIFLLWNQKFSSFCSLLSSGECFSRGTCCLLKVPQRVCENMLAKLFDWIHIFTEKRKTGWKKIYWPRESILGEWKMVAWHWKLIQSNQNKLSGNSRLTVYPGAEFWPRLDIQNWLLLGKKVESLGGVSVKAVHSASQD